MAPALPPGHPGDTAWRLPLGRILASMKAVSEEQLAKALAGAKTGGLYLTHLQEAGVSSEKLLRAWSMAVGLEMASSAEVRRPPKSLAEAVDGDACWQWLAVPYRQTEGKLSIAFVVPPPNGANTGLPPHTATLALENDVRAGLQFLFPKTEVAAPAEPEPPPAPIPERVSDDDLRRAGLVVHATTPASSGPDKVEQLQKLKVPAIVVGVLFVGYLLYTFMPRHSAKTAPVDAPAAAAAASPTDDAAPADDTPSPGSLSARPPMSGTLEALTATITAMTSANQDGAATDFWVKCGTLTAELSSYGPNAPTASAKADLMSLAKESRGFCAKAGKKLQPKTWAELRRRVLRVLSGEVAGTANAVQDEPQVADDSADSDADAG